MYTAYDRYSFAGPRKLTLLTSAGGSNALRNGQYSQSNS